MGSLGIHAVFIVTAKGHVLHERIMFPGDSTPVVSKSFDDIVVHVVGDEGQSHLELSQVVDNLGAGIREVLRGKKILEPVVLESYGRVCLAVEEIVMAGSMDPGDIDGLKDRIELKELSER